MPELNKEIGATMLTVYGAGTILGAGIYVLIGKIAGEAGYWLPLAFVVAALVAGVNGLVYAELSTRSPSAGGPRDYLHKAFRQHWLSVTVGWLIVATGVVSAATIANGFAGYLSHFADIADWIVKLALLLVLGGVAAAGAKESAWFMAITTTLGILGLLWVMYLGFFHGTGNSSPWEAYASSVPSLTDVSVLTGVLTASFLAVYAFIGFEDIVHVAEEVNRPKRAIPIAIVVALILSSVLYVAVSFAALMLVEPQALAESKAPLVEVNKAAGYPSWPLVVLSLWIILNGALAQIIMATRVLYSMGKNSGAPAWMSKVSKRTETPLIATGLATGVIVILAIPFSVKALASATSLIMLVIFGLSNIALIVLEKRSSDAPFDVPVFLPWVGLLLCAGLISGSFLVPGGGH